MKATTCRWYSYPFKKLYLKILCLLGNQGAASTWGGKGFPFARKMVSGTIGRCWGTGTGFLGSYRGSDKSAALKGSC